MKLNLHARIEIGLALALLLGSCADNRGVTRDEVMNIADDAVDSSELSGRIEQLESRLVELEERAALNSANIDSAFANDQSDRDVANDNAEIYNAFKNQTLRRLEQIEYRLNM